MLRRLLLFALVMLVLILPSIAPAPAHADSFTARANAIMVVKSYGSHTYILHGELWHYADHRLDIQMRQLRRWDGVYDLYVTVTRLGDGRVVGDWFNSSTVVYRPGNWESYLADLAAGIPPK